MTTSSDYKVSHADEPAQDLRERFAEDGYLFLKRAVAADDCDALRTAMLDVLHPHVTWDPVQAKPLLTGQPFYETDAIWDQVYPRIQRLEAFHRFFHSPAMLRLMERIQGRRPWVYPIKMARVATPRMLGYETPPHQDAYSHHAGPTMAGIWVALHDVDASMGRVTVLPGSHKGGVRDVFQAQGVGGVQCEIYEHETHWHVSDFEKGDVLIFNSATVHRAEPNTAADKVRISVDTRFCDYGAPVFSTNLEPHHGWRIEGLDWENIYAGWKSRDEQYYWESYPNTF
ncbi:phytanoyl-CoA dioxygenase family protein [Pseudohalioglobus sediminis]|uniref:Phytanoyl-CoA dioxygenase family protein n=1 Tax=Pseudohalioglobus sediminis TaxID=2606449 RepID=A0A5B0WZP9_9GAMM|nr:phytanoyl-CoA dioxygenase family protein [Pseudohalioglobus sediminis]KAA1192560.1 phytanoyl-CoA dioxygenase family protein [Pseudohalioglobus sediminis]